MGLLERQAREIPYDDSEPVLQQDPEHPNRYSYTSNQGPLFRVRLERGMRGTYGYEITYETSTIDHMLEALRQIDAALRAEYCRTTNESLRER